LKGWVGQRGLEVLKSTLIMSVISLIVGGSGHRGMRGGRKRGWNGEKKKEELLHSRAKNADNLGSNRTGGSGGTN